MIDLLLGMAVAISGLLVALVLSKGTRSSEDNWLAAWFGVYCAMSLCFLVALHTSGLLGGIAVVLATSLIVLTGPFLYLYARAATGQTPRRLTLHFLPFGINLASSLALLLGGQAQKVGVALMINLDSSFAFLLLLPPFILLGTLAYPWFSWVALTRWRETLKSELSALEAADFRWVRVWILSSVFLTFALLFSGLAINSGLVPLSLYIGICLGAFCLQLGFVGYQGLTQASVFGLGRSIVSARSTSSDVPIADSDDIAALKQLMGSERPHLTPGLTIDQLSDQLGWDPMRVSGVIQHGLQSTYFDFINGLRVEEVKALMADPANGRITLLSLAMDAGFGSKSAFNEAFKRHVGETPSHYRRSQAQS